MTNIAVLVSGGGTNLQALIDAQKNGNIKNGEIKLVIASNKNAFALTRASQNSIETAVLSLKECGSRSEFDDKLIALLVEHNIGLIVLAGFLTILSKNVIEKYENKIINIHPSLIPSFCGAGFYGLKVHEKAIEKGVKITGATVHFVNEIADDGAIILQKAVEVLNDDTPEILQKRVMEQAEWNILPRAVSLFCQNKIKVIDGKTKIEQ
ncbi:MAG: phosphoribosylglycinamide formyltransferase [Oscillospiraceae bacterium]